MKTFESIPRRSLAVSTLGVFLIFSTLGLAVDVIQMGRQSILRFVSVAVLFGVSAIFYGWVALVLREKFWKVLIPVFIAEIVLVGRLVPDLVQPTQMGLAEIGRLQSRLLLTGWAVIVSVVLGYACFVYFTVTEGRRYARVHAEIALANEIHRVLVPAIDARIGDFEFYGRSLPSGEVGGDLIDVFENNGSWIAYVADVSGHGVAPGVLMGMVKSAAHMQLSSREGSAELLERLHYVLYPIKKPEMFVTFAYLAWNGRQLEYSLAGHPAILHYHANTQEISELACPNLPLGLFEQQQFARGLVRCAPGDLFLLLTDGLLEVANARDEQFGLAGVKAIMSVHARNHVNALFQEVLDAARYHGRATDDQSLLLVRSRCHVF